MTKMSKKRKIATAEVTVKRAILSAFYGVVPAIITMLGLFIILAFVSLRCPNPRAAAHISGYAALYLSSFIGGIFSYKRCGGYPLICGLSFGVIYAFSNWIVSLLPPEGIFGNGVALILRLLSVCMAMCGSLVMAYKPKKHKIKRKR